MARPVCQVMVCSAQPHGSAAAVPSERQGGEEGPREHRAPQLVHLGCENKLCYLRIYQKG